jgi:peptidoglycan-associated lipoprotein
VKASRSFAPVAAVRLAGLVGLLALAACGRTATEPVEPRLGMAPSQHQGGYGRFERRRPIAGSAEAFKTEAGDLVYFSSDNSDLIPESRQTLEAQVRWLQRYPSATITIEGHADERGTREYNIALGVRRAEAVRAYLAERGIDARRLRTVSFGKERPVAVCNDISCWSRNRRAQTVLGGGAATAQRW